MKITTTIEVTKQEKNILYNALQAYQEYLNKMLQENQQGFAQKIVEETIATTNKLFIELEQSI